MKIKSITGREIFDSRGNPTVEACVILENGVQACASVPSGASTGKYEAVELRDGGARLCGKGVLKAVDNVGYKIADALVGKCVLDQRKLDQLMIDLDGTENKSVLGANATLAVSLACAKAGAKALGIPLYRYIGGISGRELPIPMLNIINGGAHANNNVDIQEFMLYPLGFDSFSERICASIEVYHALKSLIKGSTAVGDEGGFAPNLEKDEDAIDLILEAVEKAGYQPGKQFQIALDAAGSEWYDNGSYRLPKSGKTMDSAQLIAYWKGLVGRYPIFSIEDGLSEHDWEGWQQLTRELGETVQLVGDDLFVTNTKRLQQGIHQKAGNSILIKPNQIGTVSETMDAVILAKKHGYTTILSHRSGETADTSIADLAVGLNAGQIKTGAPARSERVEKYNRLLAIEKELDLLC